MGGRALSSEDVKPQMSSKGVPQGCREGGSVHCCCLWAGGGQTVSQEDMLWGQVSSQESHGKVRNPTAHLGQSQAPS